MILSLVRPSGEPSTRASPSPQDYFGNSAGLTEEIMTIARRERLGRVSIGSCPIQ